MNYDEMKKDLLQQHQREIQILEFEIANARLKLERAELIEQINKLKKSYRAGDKYLYSLTIEGYKEQLKILEETLETAKTLHQAQLLSFESKFYAQSPNYSEHYKSPFPLHLPMEVPSTERIDCP